MITSFELYQKICGNANTQQGGHIKPNTNFIDWVNDTSFALFEEKFASSWEKSQKIDDDLAQPFLKSINIEVKAVPGAGYGIIKYPEDYGHFSTARFFLSKESDKDGSEGFLCGCDFHTADGKVVKDQKCKPAFISQEVWDIMETQKDAEDKKDGNEIIQEKFEEIEIDKVVNSRWGALCKHRFNKPTKKKPKITQFDGGFKIAPAGIKVIVLDYLRKPNKATFEYTVIAGDPTTGKGDTIVYNANSSKPLEWSDLAINEFTNRIEKKYGKFIRNDFLWQTSEADRSKGA